ncbi:MAG TPA: amidohydrolase family protein [Solirubrobacteraceae bacterium]|nr:amidohydrolase family protein [Solirubrobacteraceae bacterium]
MRAQITAGRVPAAGLGQSPATRQVRPGNPLHTRDLLRNAAREARARGLDRMLIVDVDAHHYESEAWPEICAHLEDPVIRRQCQGANLSLVLPSPLGNQDVGGRITRYRLRSTEPWEDEGPQRDLVIARRAMDMIGIDYQVLFPTPMLYLGLHPQPEVEVALARAYASWLCERVLAHEPRIRTMLYLPFCDPEASLRLVREFADAPGVVGFMVTAVRYRCVHENDYLPLYRELEQRGMPLGFHAGYTWQGDRRLESLNSFASVHALGFVIHNLVHLTNWVMNGMPERFPDLKVIWIETGLACIPFLMQRLDHEYAMRSSEAPLLRRRPSEYMREMYYTSQPLERTDDEALQVTMRMIDAESHLLYSSDYPHWDFDLPSRIYDLPFLSEPAKRNILGETAARLFGLPERRGDPHRAPGRASVDVMTEAADGGVMGPEPGAQAGVRREVDGESTR